MDAEQLRSSVEPATQTNGSTATWWRAVRASGPVTAPCSTALSWANGAQAAHAAVDAGAGALLLISDALPSAHARAIVAIFCALDASAVTPSGLDDLQWMEQCSTIRDAIPRLRQRISSPEALLADDPELAWLTSCIAHAAARRTPVVIGGALATIAALCAQRIDDAISGWVQIGIADDDVAAIAARRRLGKNAWLTTTLPLDRAMRTALLQTAITSLDAIAAPGLSD